MKSRNRRTALAEVGRMRIGWAGPFWNPRPSARMVAPLLRADHETRTHTALAQTVDRAAPRPPSPRAREWRTRVEAR